LDTTTYNLNPGNEVVVTPVDTKNVYQVNNNEILASVSYCVNAEGTMLNPELITRQCLKNKKMIEKECADKGIIFTQSVNAHQSHLTFEHFIKRLVPKMNKPAILFLGNNDASFYRENLTEYCLKENIFMKALPANSSHIFQSGT